MAATTAAGVATAVTVWLWRHGHPPRPREYNYTEGTLIIDGYDSKEKKMVWRGTGTVTVKDNPEKRSKQIDKILHKLGSKWDKILKNKGK